MKASSGTRREGTCLCGLVFTDAAQSRLSRTRQELEQLAKRGYRPRLDLHQDVHEGARQQRHSALHSSICMMSPWGSSHGTRGSYWVDISFHGV